MLTFPKLAVTVAILSLIDRTNSFSMGAPDSACTGMTPGHAHSPKTGFPPANITLTKNIVLPGKMIGIELASTDDSLFKGFIIQARDVKQKDRQIGSFVVSGDDASYMTCGRGIHNSITHRKSNGKSSVKAQWLAPKDFEGEVVFRYSCLTGYDTFWVGLETDTVRVTRSIEEPSEPKSEPTKSEPSVKPEVVKENILEPSPKAEGELNNVNSIEVVDKNDIAKDAAKNSEFDFAFIDSKKEEELEVEVDYNDIPQPAQRVVIPQPSSSTEEKVSITLSYDLYYYISNLNRAIEKI